MAGGIFNTMNKARPGAYINFKTTPEEVSYIGERGIVTMALPLHWGGENKLIELSANDLRDGNSLSKVGLVNTESDALLLNLLLQNCTTAKLYNTYKNGVKATATLTVPDTYVLTSDTEIISGKTYYTRSGTGTTEDPYEYTVVASPDVSDIATYYEKLSGVTVTAKHPGTFGNKIAIVVTDMQNFFVVETYANGYYVETQKVTDAQSLVSNDYVDFVTDGRILTATNSILLSGGSDGTLMDGSEYLTQEKYFGLLKATKFHTIGSNTTSEEDKVKIIQFIEDMRDKEGKYVQGVVANAEPANANYEGIINVVNGVILNDGTTISAADFVAWVTGATAGASIAESLTGMIVPNAIGIVDPLNNDEIIEGLNNGKFILSLNQNGTVKVEKDINSLHTFVSGGKDYDFSKNRVIRELDEIGSNIEDIWEQTYLGKVSANAEGRELFKSSLINLLTELRDEGAIQAFNTDSIIVEQGPDIDSVIASIAVQPLDSMEFLYMTVNIS